MVTMEKVQRGLAAFIDRELIPSLSGWDKVLVGGGAGLAVAKLPQMIAQYPIVATLGVYDKENNQVDIDALYQAIVPYIGTEALPVKIPMLGITVKMGRQEIDTLYKYIKEV
jgi:hypothetical protein